MKKNLNIEKKYIVLIIIVIVIIILGLLSYTLKKKESLNVFESTLKDGIVSIENVIFYPFRYTVNLISEFKELKDVKKENDILKSKIDKVESIETENIELRKELEDLKNELNITYVLTDYDTINGTVISRNINYWYNTVTINKGTDDGIKEEMPVINSYGLVGKVISTTKKTSTVRLLTTTDSNNKISVTIKSDNKSLHGLINGYNKNDNTLLVEGISNTKNVVVGSKVYTSGLGGVFPSGILIGTVESISKDDYDLSKIIKVTPNVDFLNINYVSILKRKDES